MSVLDLDSLRDAGATMASAQASQDVAAVRAVVALRAKAAEVVEAELIRLGGKLGDLDDQAHAEVTQAMHRVADKLLYAPTARVKELAESARGDSYEIALRMLFDLDPGRSPFKRWARPASPGDRTPSPRN